MMTQQDQQVTCTGDVWCGCTCADCAVTFTHCKPSPVIRVGDELDVALALDKAANLLTLVTNDLEGALPQLRDGHPMWCSVDIVSALGHLRIAARKVDQAADRIDQTTVTQ